MKTHNCAVFRRNLFVAAALTSIAAALVLHPEVLALLATRGGLLVLAFIVGAGFFGALGIREFAEQYLPGQTWPWYTRRGSWLFVPLALFCVTLLGGIAYLAAMHIVGQRPIEPRAMGAIFLAAQLVWIVVLDWPSAHRQQHDTGERPHGDQCPSWWTDQDRTHEEER